MYVWYICAYVCTFISTISIPFKLFLTPKDKTLTSALAGTEKSALDKFLATQNSKRIDEYVKNKYRNSCRTGTNG